jgi:hypothetical protein
VVCAQAETTKARSRRRVKDHFFIICFSYSLYGNGLQKIPPGVGRLIIISITTFSNDAIAYFG